MSHAPPQKCWACAKPMAGGDFFDTRMDCAHCAFFCCGECLLKHYRAAHPVAYAEQWLPTLKVERQRLSVRRKPDRSEPPDNVAYLAAYRPHVYGGHT